MDQALARSVAPASPAPRTLEPESLRVAIDVGSTRHRVAVGLGGKLLDEFDISIVKGARVDISEDQPPEPVFKH